MTRCDKPIACNSRHNLHHKKLHDKFTKNITKIRDKKFNQLLNNAACKKQYLLLQAMTEREQHAKWNQVIFSTPCELGGWGWSHPFSSGPGIFLYKMPCLNLQNVLPGNFSTKCLALDRLLHYKMSAEKGLKQGWIWFVFHHDGFRRLFSTIF